MPDPFTVIGGVVAVASLGTTVHTTWKRRKWKKILDERLLEIQPIEVEFETTRQEFSAAAESLGRARVDASETLEKAAECLRGVVKQYNLDSLPEVPDEMLGEWVSLRSEIAETLGLGLGAAAMSGTAAVAGPAIYTAAGLFGVASTGTRIGTLAGAAANSARLAWIGGGALSAGGGGMALGSTILNVASKANIVLAPISIAAGIWSEKKAHDYEKLVTAKLEEFAQYEKKLRGKMTAMRVSVPRMNEIQGSVAETDLALKDLLDKVNAISIPHPNPLVVFLRRVFGFLPFIKVPEPDYHLLHQIYLTAATLRELIEEPGISETHRRIIFEE